MSDSRDYRCSHGMPADYNCQACNAGAQPTTAEQLSTLAYYTSKLQDVETYEKIRLFRAFSQRCSIAAERQRTLIALECGMPLVPLAAQVVRESRKQLEALNAQIKRALEAANRTGCAHDNQALRCTCADDCSCRTIGICHTLVSDANR